MSGDSLLAFGEFQIDIANRLLMRGKEPVALTPKAFDTLLVLIDQRQRVMPKDELIETVWPGTFVSDATLTQNIYTLRKVLDDGSGQQWIRTVPRRGYRFDGEVRTVDAVEAQSPARHDAVTEDEIRSLAVLPLHSLTPDEGPVLGLGLADAVITSLSNVQQLAVRSTRSILRYAEPGDHDPVAIGRQLGVDGVLEGTVQQHGSRMRVTVQLVSVARGVACWADSIQGSYDDVFAAQDGVAREVVARLRVRLTRQEEAGLTRHPTEDLEAYRTYVRGRFLWNRRTAADLRRAIELFRQAAARDPSYSQAFSGLADALILLPFYGGARPTDAFRQARDAAKRALELDDGLADAHTSLAYTDFVYSHDWQSAEAGFRRAMEHDPSYPTAYHWYAFLLTALGRHREAIQLAQQAHELEPLSLVISTDLALAHYFARRNDEALGQLESVLEVAPDFGYAYFALALCRSARQEHEAAMAAGERACQLLTDSGAARAVFGYAAARAGHEEQARLVLDELSDLTAGRVAQASHRALIEVGLDNFDGALEELRQGYEERSRFVVFLGVWPAFDPLREHPAFDELLGGLGLTTR